MNDDAGINLGFSNNGRTNQIIELLIPPFPWEISIPCPDTVKFSSFDKCKFAASPNRNHFYGNSNYNHLENLENGLDKR